MAEQKITPEDIAEYQEQMKSQEEESRDESIEDQQATSQGFMEALSGSQPQNKDAFLHKSAFDTSDTLRTSYLNEFELGRPMFSVRTLLELKNLADHHMSQVVEMINLETFNQHEEKLNDLNAEKEKALEKKGLTKKEINKIKEDYIQDVYILGKEYIPVVDSITPYIEEKIQGITNSGMSNEGFISNLTASRKLEISRKKYDTQRIENLKGSKKI